MATVHRWTPEDDDYLRATYETTDHAAIAKHLKRTENSVRNRCWRLGLQKKIARHPPAVRGRILEYYAAHIDKPMKLAPLAAELGMSKATIARIARDDYGLTDLSRSPTPEAAAKTGAAISFYARMGKHPRGMLGKHHAASTKQRISESEKRRFSAMTPEERGAHILRGLKTKRRKGSLIRPRTNVTWTQGHRTVGGKRIYFRSKWEMNYARYLEWLKGRGGIKSWEYEPTTFWFEAIKRGTRSYTPDFRVTENSGAVAYHEVKGWMDDRSKTKLKRMAKYHPTVQIVLVDAAAYRELMAKVARLVPEWE